MTKSINLYVDDMRDAPEGFFLARSADEAIDYMNHYAINILSLDHDLGPDQNGHLAPTGYDLVKFFCEQGYFAHSIYLHTSNPVGLENMYETLKASQKSGFISSNITVYNHPLTYN